MSPTAVYSPSENIFAPPQTSHSKGPALVIGSLSTAEDGKYQTLVSELEPTRSVEKQLLDRIVDEGVFWRISSSSLSLTHLAQSSHVSAIFIL